LRTSRPGTSPSAFLGAVALETAVVEALQQAPQDTVVSVPDNPYQSATGDSAGGGSLWSGADEQSAADIVALDMAGRRGERGYTAKPQGTPTPNKKYKWNKKTGRWEYKDPLTGKKIVKPEGFDPNCQ
jgi:hypothetical protein